MKNDPRRSLPYGPIYFDAVIRAKDDERSLYDVDMEFMAENGWTEENEAEWRRNMAVLGYKLLDMYPPGHAPANVADPYFDTKDWLDKDNEAFK